MTVYKQIPNGLYSLFHKNENFRNNTGYTAYEYRDEKGATLGAACRIDYAKPDGKKDKTFFQTSYKKTGDKWIQNGQGFAGVLYDLPELAAAKTILFVEGEKAVEAVKPILPEGWAATTGAGGAANYRNLNFTSLRGKDIIIWRDNDEAGQTGAVRANAKMLQDGCNVVGWVKIDPEWQPKWDVYDILEKHGAPYVIECLKRHENFNDKVKDIVPKVEVADLLPFKVLGQNAVSDVFFYSYGTGLITSCNSRTFDEMKMIEIHNDEMFWQRFCGIKGEGNKINKVQGWSHIWKEVQDIGLYSEEKIRGFGTFRDHTPEGKPVFVANLGDTLYIDGQKVQHADFCHNHVYVKDKSAGINLDAPPMSDDEARQVLTLFEMLQIRTQEKRQAFLGLIVSSMYAGALPNRPHAWMYANGNNGKSFIREQAMRLLSGFATGVAGNTTPAGVRQDLAGASRLVTWEEAETTDDNVNKYQAVMEMARLSFDAVDDSIVMGSKDGKGKKYIPRMMFLFTSIRMINMDEANASRMMTFDLVNLKSDSEETRLFKTACESAVMSIKWNEISSRLFMRCYQNADVYMHNLNMAKVYLKTQCEVDSRRASAMAAMFAGWQIMKHTNRLSLDDVHDVMWVEPKKMMPQEISETSSFKEKLFGAMVTAHDHVSGRMKKISLSQVIVAARNNEGFVRGVTLDDALNTFETHGVKYYKDRKGNKEIIAIWDKAPELQRILWGYKQGMREIASSLPDYQKDVINRFGGSNKRSFTFSIDTADFE